MVFDPKDPFPRGFDLFRGHNPKADIIIGIPVTARTSSKRWVRRQRVAWKPYESFMRRHSIRIVYFIGECTDKKIYKYGPLDCTSETRVYWSLSDLRYAIGGHRLVVLPGVNDGYYRMGYKMLHTLYYVYEYYDFKWFVKIDPDTFVHIPRLYNALRESEIKYGDPRNITLYLGKPVTSNVVLDEGKFRNPQWRRRYHFGQLYVFSLSAVDFIRRIDPLGMKFYVDQNDDAGIGLIFGLKRTSVLRTVNITHFSCENFYLDNCRYLLESLPEDTQSDLLKAFDGRTSSTYVRYKRRRKRK